MEGTWKDALSTYRFFQLLENGICNQGGTFLTFAQSRINLVFAFRCRRLGVIVALDGFLLEKYRQKLKAGIARRL